jgi:hypothetical protein
VHADVAAVSTHIESSPRFPVSKLKLNHCSLGVEGMSLIAQSIVERKPKNLKTFEAAANMSPGFFTSSSSIHACQTALARLIKSSEPLIELNLSGGDSHKFGEHIIPVAEALKHSKTLLKVDLSDHKAGDKLAVAVGEVLKENSVLRQVSIDKNGTSAKGFKALADGAASSSSLLSIGPPVRDYARAERVAATKELFSSSRDILESVCAKNAKDRPASARNLQTSPSTLEVPASTPATTSSPAADAEDEDGIIVVDAGNRQRAYSRVLQKQKSALSQGVSHPDDDDDDDDGGGSDNDDGGGDADNKIAAGEPSPAPGSSEGGGEDDDDDEAMRKLLKEAKLREADFASTASTTDVVPDCSRGSIIETTRSSMEEKLYMLQLARAEADDVRKEMEEKLKQSKENEDRLIAEAKAQAEEAMREAIRAEMNEEMKSTMEGEIKAAKEAAIAEAGKEAEKLQQLLKENKEQVAALTEGAEQERLKLEETLNDKAQKELKEQMMILKKVRASKAKRSEAKRRQVRFWAPLRPQAGGAQTIRNKLVLCASEAPESSAHAPPLTLHSRAGHGHGGGRA